MYREVAEQIQRIIKNYSHYQKVSIVSKSILQSYRILAYCRDTKVELRGTTYQDIVLEYGNRANLRGGEHQEIIKWMEIIEKYGEKRIYPGRLFIFAQQLRQFYHYMLQNELTERVCSQSNKIGRMIKQFHYQEDNMWQYIGKSCLKASQLKELLICIEMPIWYQNLFKDQENLVKIRIPNQSLRGGISGVLCTSSYQEYQYLAESMQPAKYGEYEVCVSNQQDYNQVIRYLNSERIPVSGESWNWEEHQEHQRWYQNWFDFWETGFLVSGLIRLVKEGLVPIPYKVQRELGLTTAELLAKLKLYQGNSLIKNQDLWQWLNQPGSETKQWLRGVIAPFEQVKDQVRGSIDRVKKVLDLLEQKYQESFFRIQRPKKNIWEGWPQGKSGEYTRQDWINLAKDYLEKALRKEHKQGSRQGMVYVTRIGQSYSDRKRVISLGFTKKFLCKYQPALWIQKDLNQMVSFQVGRYTFKEWLVRKGFGLRSIKEVWITQSDNQVAEAIWGRYTIKREDIRDKSSEFIQEYSPVIKLPEKENKKRYTLSASSLAIYKTCPRKFDFKYNRKYQGQNKDLTKGWPWESIKEKSSWIHQQLAIIGSNSEFQEMSLGKKIDWATQRVQENLKKYRKLWSGKQDYFEYWSQHQIINPIIGVIKQFGEKTNQVACEESFEIKRPEGSFDIIGRVDRREQSSAGIKIIDYKWKQGGLPKVAEDLYWQMDLYIWVYSQKYSQYRVTGEYWFIGEQQEVYKVKVSNQGESRRRAEKKIQVIDELLKRKYFKTGGKKPLLKHKSCSHCEYRILCQRVQEQEEGVELQELYQELEK